MNKINKDINIYDCKNFNRNTSTNNLLSINNDLFDEETVYETDSDAEQDIQNTCESTCYVSNNLNTNTNTNTNTEKNISEEDTLEMYYLTLKDKVELDNSINFDELSKKSINEIELILQDKLQIDKYFKEILKYLKLYTFIEFNYFQLAVIYNKIGVSKNYKNISNYIRLVTKPVMIEDTILINTLKRNKPYKIFKELYYNLDEKKNNKVTNNIYEFYINKYDIIIKCLVRLNYKLTEKFGILSSCICVKDINNTKSTCTNIITNNYIELINLLRIIYCIKPNCY